MLTDGYLWLLVVTCAISTWMMVIRQHIANSQFV